MKHGYRLQWRMVTGYGESWLQATVEDGHRLVEDNHRLQWRMVTGYGEAWLQASGG